MTESWNPKDLKRKEKGSEEEEEEEEEETEESWNQMSRLSWETKKNRMRSGSKLHQVTESWNPKDLKRKEMEPEERGRNRGRRRRN